MLQLPDDPPDDHRHPWLAIALVLLAVSFLASTCSHLGCSLEESTIAVEPVASSASHCDDIAAELRQARDHLAQHEAFDVQAEHESAVIAAELRGFEQCMYSETRHDVGLQNQPATLNVIQTNAHAQVGGVGSPDDVSKSQKVQRDTGQPEKQWPQVLSVFTSADPSKPDRLAGSSSAWPLPSETITAESMASGRSTWKRRAVQHDDMAVALRGVPRYTLVRVCQSGRCATAWTATTGPWGALCLRPDDCVDGRPCKAQTGDITRRGDTKNYWWTIQPKLDGPCSYRGLVDVTPAVCAAIQCKPMKPATVTRL